MYDSGKKCCIDILNWQLFWDGESEWEGWYI